MILQLLLVFSIIAYIFIKNELRRSKYPNGPYPWPFIGNVFQMDINAPELTLNLWRDKYGKVFTIWLPEPIVVLTDGTLMDETFSKAGEAFAGRPRSAIMDILFKGNYGLMLNENDVYKSQRRFALHNLKNFGFGRADLEPLMLMSIEDSIEKELARNGNTGRVNSKRLYAVANAPVMHKLVFGNPPLTDPEKIMEQKFAVENVFCRWYHPTWMMLEAMPWLLWLEKLNIYDLGVGKADKHNQVFINFLQSHIEAHRQRRKDRDMNHENAPQDYADCFLDEMEKVDADKGFEDWQFAIACYDLWAAGVETVTTTLQYATMYLLYNPEVQRKLKQELAQRHSDLSYAALKKLPYLNAFIQEVHRLANVIPLSLIHETLEPTEIEGYKFTPGTCVIAQLACFNLDPKEFPEPEKCIPERHIDKDTGEFKPDGRLKPFSIGRRSCLGEALARPQTAILLAHVLSKYTVKPFADKLPVIGATPALVRIPHDFDFTLIPDAI